MGERSSYKGESHGRRLLVTLWSSGGERGGTNTQVGFCTYIHVQCLGTFNLQTLERKGSIRYINAGHARKKFAIV